MSSRTVTIELPEPIYDKAAQQAQDEKRPIEDVLIEWLSRASAPKTALPSPFEDAIKALDDLAPVELIEIARRRLTPQDEKRLEILSARYDEGNLSEEEHREVLRLASKQDEIAVLRARSLQILRERNVDLPDDLKAANGFSHSSNPGASESSCSEPR